MKVVIIGTGFGELTAAPAYRAAGCEVQVISPRNPEAVRMAIEAPCDLVSVHSPPFMHLEHVRLATAARRHVLCDKPFGRNAAEARQMLDLATSAGVLHFLNFEFRNAPVRVKLKELLGAGAIGDPVHVTWAMHTSMGRGRRHGWLFDKELGGGWIGAFGSHVVDALRWLFGEVAETTAQTRTEVKARRDREKGEALMHACTAEDAFTAWLRMQNGVTVAFDSAFAASVNAPERIIVFGTAGALQVDNGRELLLLRPGRGTEHFDYRTEETDPHKPGIDIWIAKVCEAVAQGRPITPDFNDGLACAVTLDALRATRPPV